jgi:leader peptidase (prepilin peptidase)/N-methyltransferase
MQDEFLLSVFYSLVIIYGLLIGSFLNVCIYRIPKKQSIVKGRSACMHCNQTISWYDLIPVVSFVRLRGRCSQCKRRISYQYPLVELINGIIYLAIAYKQGPTFVMLLYALASSLLLVVSIIDWRTFEIPPRLSLGVMGLGVIRSLIDLAHWHVYVIGFFSISLPLLILYILTKGKGIGGGDVKLMAAIGLLLGWKLTIFAFMFACIAAMIIHLSCMYWLNKGSVLAFGPYLAAGALVAMIYGQQMISWYIQILLSI